MADFELNEGQLAMQKMARDFAQKEIKPVAMERDKILDPKEAFPVDFFKKSFELGFHKTNIPTKYGGLGLDCLTHALIWEEFGAADAGFCVSYQGHAMALAFSMNMATEEQLEIFLRPIAEGEGCLVAVACTEPNVGPGALIIAPTEYKLETTARLEGDHYVINGEKIFCTNGGTPLVKLYWIWARTDMTKTGTEAHSTFYVLADTPGIIPGKAEEKMGQRLSYNTALLLDGVKVHKSQLVGGVPGIPGPGPRVTTMESYVTIGALMVGLARSAYEEALNFAKQRIILGKPSIQHQLVGAKLADMFIEIEAARALTWKAARNSDQNPLPDYKLAWATKVMSSDVAVKVAGEAVQIWGGIGYSKGNLVEKLYRDAKITQIYENANEVLRLGIARMLEWGI